MDAGWYRYRSTTGYRCEAFGFNSDGKQNC